MFVPLLWQSCWTPAANADQELFHDLYQLHHRRVYSICLRMTQDISRVVGNQKTSHPDPYAGLTRQA